MRRECPGNPVKQDARVDERGESPAEVAAKKEWANSMSDHAPCSQCEVNGKSIMLGITLLPSLFDWEYGIRFGDLNVSTSIKKEFPGNEENTLPCIGISLAIRPEVVSA
jgi:hypothetical protein